MKTFREYLAEAKIEKEIDLKEGLVFSTHGKDINYLEDAAVKSIKALPDTIGLKDTGNYKNLKNEAKTLADSVEKFVNKLISLSDITLM